MIHLQDVPFMYRLSARNIHGDTPSLTLLLHRTVVEHALLQNLLSNNEIIEFQQGLKLGDFSPALAPGNKFGFENSFVVHPWENDLLPVSIAIPVAEKRGRPCYSCEEWDEPPTEDYPCFNCMNTRHEIDYIHGLTKAGSATLTTVFCQLRAYLYYLPHDREQGVRAPFQLINVETVTRYGSYGGAISGELATPMMNWLTSLGPADLSEVSAAMIRVHQHLYPLSHGLHDAYEFSCHVSESGYLTINFPGDACGLHLSDHDQRLGTGAMLVCHNLDNFDQQLGLLTGLGALNDMAVTAGVGQ